MTEDSRKTTGKQQFVEEFGLVFEQMGMPRMPGRVMGYLMVADPAEQTMGQIVEGLGAAKSSVSTALKVLERLSFIERKAYPGHRADFYRASAHPWATSLQASNLKFAIFRDLAERGLEMIGEEKGRSRRMLSEMRDLYATLEEEWPAIVEQILERIQQKHHT